MNTKTILPIKIGTNCNVKDGIVNKQAIERIAKDILEMQVSRNKNPVIIFSGALALGMREMGCEEKPKDIIKRKIYSSVGQKKLTAAYSNIFEKYGLTTGQFLFTYRDLDDIKNTKELKESLCGCFEEGVIPLINFNDPLNAEEIFADNDRFAAKITNLLGARELLILTHKVNGFLDNDGKVIAEIEIKKIDELEEYKKFCTKEVGEYSTGGMITKLEAVQIVLEAGGIFNRCIIGNIKYDMKDLLYGECPRTVFRKIGHVPRMGCHPY